MLRSSWFRTVMFIFCTLVAACALEKKVYVTEKNFKDEIQTQQNLVFKFNRELAPDSAINVWDTTAYLKIVPEVKGSFKWISENELIFSPSGEFAPATSYTATLTSNLNRFTGGQFEVENSDPVVFNTPLLKAMSSQAWWQVSPDDPGAVSLNLTINFNYPIDPAVISRFVSVKINGKKEEFRVSDNNVSSSLKLRSLSLSRELVKGAEIEYALKEGALCFSCNNATKEIQTSSQEVTGPDKLEIVHVEGTLESGSGKIIVYTNQEVNMTGLSTLVKITPAVNFDVESNGNGFIINGNFESGSSYQLEINKQLSGAIGGSLTNDFTAFVPFGEMEPSIGFVHNKGMYMSTQSSRKIAVNIINIPKIHVRIFKIYENNILAFMKYHRYNDYYEEEGSSAGFGYNDYDIDNLGDVIMDQNYETKNLAKSNGVSLLNLDFDEFTHHRGIYFVTVSSTDNRWTKASKMISISDIGLIVRKAKEETYVFANSIKDATPVKGSKITFFSTNNQEIGTAVTGSDGVAILKTPEAKLSGFTIGMITARHEKDFNYLAMGDARVENSRFDIGGKISNPAGYEAYIYGDREIYRPGETVYFNVIVRNTLMKPLAGVPVRIKIVMPNGREYTNIRKTLSGQGSAEGMLQLSTSSVTGTWSMEIYSSNNILLASRNISVEEFIPDRISVTTSVNSTMYESGDSIRSELRAMNLFGTPAAQRNYQMDFSLRKKSFASKEFAGYNFNISGAENIVFQNILREGKTSVEGRASEIFPLSPAYAFSGLLNGRIYITVFDETGRPVNRVENFDVSTQEVYYGIRLNEYYNNTRQPIQMALAAADRDGKSRSSSNVRLQVVKVDWETVVERNEGSYYRYVSQKKEKVLVDKTVSIPQGGTNFSFTPNESGEYFVRLQNPGAGTYVQSEFYAYGWGTTQNSAFQVNNEGEVEMTFDKTSYTPGDKAKILFKTPFAGKLLVTVERDKIFEHFYITTDKRSAAVEIPVKEEYLPNAYITATLFRPLDDGQMPVTIGHGFAPLPVEKQSNKLPVEITVSAKSRSNTRQTVTIKTIPKSDIEITVAVVDEGIMQLKNSESPDPYKFFYQKRALEVIPYDIYPAILPDIGYRNSSTGGDGYDLQKRVNPMSNKRVKLVAYWSGILKTNGNGVVSCSVDIPQFSGDLRVMAVAYKNETFGSAEKHIKVANPVIISPSIPRFLTPGDELLMPVTISNTTDKDQKINITVEKSGPLSVSNTGESSITIPANGEMRPVFKISAAKQIGEGSLTVKVNNSKEIFTDKTFIAVRPASSLQKISGSGEIKGGETAEISLANNFIESSRSGKIVISRSPVVQFSDHMSYLLTYPYGCVEQTISAAFPQLYYTSLAKAILNKPGVVQVSTNVEAAITRLQSMQQHNGSMSYWPGSAEETWWGSAYASHFLNEAKAAGYEVSQVTLDKLAAYLAAKIKKHPVETYYYYDANGTEVVKKIPAKDIFYSLYILALYHKADMATMNYYRSRINELALDSEYLLAAAYLATGDRKSYQQLLPGMFAGEKSKKATGGNFHSYIRDEAIALNALLETDPGNIQIPDMVKHLSAQMKTEKYLSTQERAFAFLALGKFMKRTGESSATAVISSGGTVIGEFKGTDLTISKGLQSGKVSLKTNGTGNLYYSWEMEGLTADGSFREEDSQLKVRKTFMTRFGQPVTNLQNFKQNDLIVVKITLTNLVRNNVDNIVISDLLPAGFEIDNPRISAVPELAWIKDNAVPDHTDIRDDRIHYFTGIGNQPKSFYYLVRAVSTGSFVMGPVSADAMYDGSYHSYHGAGTIKISE